MLLQFHQTPSPADPKHLSLPRHPLGAPCPAAFPGLSSPGSSWPSGASLPGMTTVPFSFLSVWFLLLAVEQPCCPSPQTSSTLGLGGIAESICGRGSSEWQGDVTISWFSGLCYSIHWWSLPHQRANLCPLLWKCFSHAYVLSQVWLFVTWGVLTTGPSRKSQRVRLFFFFFGFAVWHRPCNFGLKLPFALHQVKTPTPCRPACQGKDLCPLWPPWLRQPQLSCSTLSQMERSVF